MPFKFGKGGTRMNAFVVKFKGENGFITRNYHNVVFALKRAYEESKTHAAYVKHRGNIIAVVQRGGCGL